MTTRKINISIPLENNGLFTYEIWQNYINDIPRVEGVDSYEVNVMLEEGWKIIYGGAFMNITEGEDIDEEDGSQIDDDNVIIFSLVNILLPSSITNINANAFTYTTNLDRLGFQRNNNIKIHPDAFRGSGLRVILMHLETLRALNTMEILDGLELKFGKNNYFYGKDNVNINDISAYTTPKAGGARKSRRRKRGARRTQKRRRRTMKRK
jgi:hypothetical protein